VLRIALTLTCALMACDSTALSIADPTALELGFEPPFFAPGVEGSQVVTVTFLGVRDVDDDEGETREVLESDFSACDVGDPDLCAGGLELVAFEFGSNWQLRLDLDAVGDTTGRYDLSFRVRNHYGVFTGTGAFFVFR